MLSASIQCTETFQHSALCSPLSHSPPAAGATPAVNCWLQMQHCHRIQTRVSSYLQLLLLTASLPPPLLNLRELEDIARTLSEALQQLLTATNSHHNTLEAKKHARYYFFSIKSAPSYQTILPLLQQLLMGNNALFTGKKDSGYSASFGGQSQQHKGTGGAQIIFKSMHHWMRILAKQVVS